MIMRKRHFFDIESSFFSFMHLFLSGITFYFHYYAYIQQSQLFFMSKLKSDGEVEFVQGINNIYWAFALVAIIASFFVSFCCMSYTFLYDIQPVFIEIFAMLQSTCYIIIWKILTIHREKARKLRNSRRYVSKFEENLDNVMIPITIACLMFSIFTIAIYILCIYIEMTKTRRSVKQK